MTPEEKQQLEQIKKVREWRQEHADRFHIGALHAACGDIDFLLSIVERQEAGTPSDLIAVKWAETLSTGEQSVLLTSSLKRLRTMIDKSTAATATAMRSACIEKVKAMRDSSLWNANSYDGALTNLITDLEALTLQKQDIKTLSE